MFIYNIESNELENPKLFNNSKHNDSLKNGKIVVYIKLMMMLKNSMIN